MKRAKDDLPEPDSKAEETSLAKPMQQFGSELMREAGYAVEGRRHEKLVHSAAWLLEMRDTFQFQVANLQSALIYIDGKLSAIRGGEFRIERGKVIFENDEYNKDHREFFGDRSEWSVG